MGSPPSIKVRKSKHEANLEPRNVHRKIHLLNVSMEFTVAYAYDVSRECFLGSHKGALRAVYRIAVALRHMLQKKLADDVIEEEYPERAFANEFLQNDGPEDAGDNENCITSRWKMEFYRIEEDLSKRVIPVSFLLSGDAYMKRKEPGDKLYWHGPRKIQRLFILDVN